MSVLFLLIPMAVIMAGVAVGAFLWSVHKGQFDDLDTPAVRAILDDDLTAGKRSSPDQRAESRRS